MARKIDPKDLDAEDRRYLRDRPWMIEEFERQGLTKEMAAVRSDSEVKEDPNEADLVTTTQMSLGTNEGNLRGTAPGNGVISDTEIVDDNYEEWSVDELKADIDDRNKEDGRETKLSKSGNKEDLIKRLREDDAL